MEGAPPEPGGQGRERGKVQRLPHHSHAVAAMVEDMWRAPYECLGRTGSAASGQSQPTMMEPLPFYIWCSASQDASSSSSSSQGDA